MAGSFTGTASAASGPFSGNITVSVKYNSTGVTVDEVVDVNGTPVPILFTSGQVGTVAAPFVLVSGSGTIRLGDFVEIHGTITFSGGTVTFTDVTFFIGQGPYKNDDGTINPSAVGIVIENASGSNTGTAGNRALSASGTVRLVGISGLTLSGTIERASSTSRPRLVQLGVPGGRVGHHAVPVGRGERPHLRGQRDGAHGRVLVHARAPTATSPSASPASSWRSAPPPRAASPR